ncbi:hypothetical protein T10_8574 [Trichinella papuae]|uniref:Uncharacterized protein n=1 Tax=Trichinella papuae TaxID=268474 RepID=A0A0V1LX69_9BILA|nr:hypothetical protein T10_1558 [Trichinella papuae]KRZ64203.1 hypothetical protein T10_8574 [Trichinella papuae]
MNVTAPLLVAYFPRNFEKTGKLPITNGLSPVKLSKTQ